VPAVRASARPERTCLPADERFPALSRTETGALALLRDGDIDVEGRLVDASNATLFCAIASNGARAQCVYKPVQGERPLWDFPDGTLAGREYAAYLLSEATGWEIVPPTVLRDGPYGDGMVQLWVDVDERVDLGDLVRADLPQLRRIALFDVIANNADRKGGHLLPTGEGHIFGCDHGLTFHVENKLRTVLWGWRDEPFDDAELEVLVRLDEQLAPGGKLRDALGALLTRGEVNRTLGRLRNLLRTGVFPQPSGDWPAVPWPPF
jgi:hypothetical protein